MCRLERLGYVLKAVYCDTYNKNLLLGMYWFKGKKKMFERDSWIAQLMNEEEPCK